VLETTSNPPERTNASRVWTLLTRFVPLECVTVISPDASITTSSSGPGRLGALLQLLVVFQSPLPPLQETVAPQAENGESRKAMTRAHAAMNCGGVFISLSSVSLFISFKPGLGQMLQEECRSCGDGV